jgi:hypothetical protein
MITSEPKPNMAFSKANLEKILNSTNITATPLGYRFSLVIDA